MKFTNDYHTVNCSSNENRVVLGSIGFSKVKNCFIIKVRPSDKLGLRVFMT